MLFFSAKLNIQIKPQLFYQNFILVIITCTCLSKTTCYYMAPSCLNIHYNQFLTTLNYHFICKIIICIELIMHYTHQVVASLNSQPCNELIILFFSIASFLILNLAFFISFFNFSLKFELPKWHLHISVPSG